jgi:hypothetical protein
VADSPYPVRVLPGAPDAGKTTVHGAGARRAAAGAPARFTVQARDAFGNACAGLAPAELPRALPLRAALLAGARGAAAAPVACVPGEGGAWECSYDTPGPGLYVLELLVALAGASALAAPAEGPAPVSSGAAGAARWRHVRGGPFGVRAVDAAAGAGPAAAGPPGAAAAAAPPPRPPRDVVAWWGAVARAEYAAADGDMAGFEEAAETGDSGDGGGAAGAAAGRPDAAYLEVGLGKGLGESRPPGARPPPLRSLLRPAAERRRRPAWRRPGPRPLRAARRPSAAAPRALPLPRSPPRAQANPGVAVVERLEDLWLLSKLQAERKAAAGAAAGGGLHGRVAGGERRTALTLRSHVSLR